MSEIINNLPVSRYLELLEAEKKLKEKTEYFVIDRSFNPQYQTIGIGNVGKVSSELIKTIIMQENKMISLESQRYNLEKDLEGVRVGYVEAKEKLSKIKKTWVGRLLLKWIEE